LIWVNADLTQIKAGPVLRVQAERVLARDRVGLPFDLFILAAFPPVPEMPTGGGGLS
jgi:hypothetical protein